MTTLISLTCNSLVNPAGDLIAVRVNGTNFTTLFFNSAGEVNTLPSSPFNGNVSVELIVKMNVNGTNKSMGTHSTAINPSPINYIFSGGDYHLRFV